MFGQDTGIDEAYAEDHSSGSGTGSVEGTGDDERLILGTGEYWEYPTWYLGVGMARITKNKYKSGSGTIIVYYRTAGNKIATELLGWTEYTGDFESAGWVGIRVEGA